MGLTGQGRRRRRPTQTVVEFVNGPWDGFAVLLLEPFVRHVAVPNWTPVLTEELVLADVGGAAVCSELPAGPHVYEYEFEGGRIRYVYVTQTAPSPRAGS